VDDSLTEQIKILNKRIDELEQMLSVFLKPMQDIRSSANSYLRLVSLLLEHGGLTPDVLLPDLQDPIAQEIVRVLTKRSDVNISQITELVRTKRGTASRRIIREKLTILEQNQTVTKQMVGSRNVYRLSDEVLKKWSQILGFTK